LLTTEKIIVFIAIWIIAALFVTGDADIEVFIILIFIGLLIAKEFTDRFTTTQLKYRMNIFIGMFLIVFVAAVAKKIMTFANI
jgi:TRAP-type C4-dicarboxylate transport system permease large subunit